MYLETKHAQAIVNMLEDAQDVGMSYVVFEQRPSERFLHPGDLNFTIRSVPHWTAGNIWPISVTYRETAITWCITCLWSSCLKK